MSGEEGLTDCSCDDSQSIGCPSAQLSFSCPANQKLSLSRVILRPGTGDDQCTNSNFANIPSTCQATVDVTAALAPLCNNQQSCRTYVSQFDRTSCAPQRVLQADFLCFAGPPNPPSICQNDADCGNNGFCVSNPSGVISW